MIDTEKYERLSATAGLSKILENMGDQLSEENVQQILEGIVFYRDEFGRAALATDQLSALVGMYEAAEELIWSNMTPARKNAITCRAGCTHCCHINLDISDVEAEMLVRFAGEHDIEIDTELLELQKGKDQSSRSVMERSGCVFLKNNRCSVYEVRPMMCRKYFVISDPEDCNVKKYPDREAMVHADLNVEMLASGLINATETGDIATMLLKTIDKVNRTLL